MLSILIPLIFLNRRFILPSLFTLALLISANYIPLWLFKYILFIALFYSSLNFIHYRRFGKPISLATLKILKEVPHLKDSIPSFAKYALLFIPAFVYTYFVPESSLPLYPTAIVFIAIPLLFIKRKETKDIKHHNLTPENEKCLYQHKDYPLEKITTGFSGEKTFKLPGNRPHVITLFLESFRFDDLEKAAPHFNELSKDGVFFSNFHSNATQTFKALFHTLYGVPALYGSEFEMTSKKMGKIHMKGLPEMFQTKGYTPIFAQGGSNRFDFQDEFLLAHNFEKIYDLKDIKKEFKDGQSTSWGIHDEYLYSFLFNKIKGAASPLFISAATISNHHPFTLPSHFNPEINFEEKDPLYRRFLQTMHYTDTQLKIFVEKLKTLDAPIHLHIMGDHGFNKDDIKTLVQSIKTEVTHVPYLILPINCGEFKGKEIVDIASHIDVMPTLMDLYHLKGENSSIGSALSRVRKDPHTYILNQIPHPPLYGYRNNEELKPNLHNSRFKYIEHLYKTKKISSKEATSLQGLSLSKEPITNEDLTKLLQSHPHIKFLNLNHCVFIHTLNLKDFPLLEKVEIDHNLLIDDLSIKRLPMRLKSLSIRGCFGLSDSALRHISRYPLKELSLSVKSFSKEALNELAKRLYSIETLFLDDADSISVEFFKNLPNNTLQNVKVRGRAQISDEMLNVLNKHPLSQLMLSNCRGLTDQGIEALKYSNLNCLFLEHAENLSNEALKSLQNLPLHTFSISGAERVDEKGIEALNSDTLQKIYCSGCNIEEKIEESLGSMKNASICFFIDQDFYIHNFKNSLFEKKI